MSVPSLRLGCLAIAVMLAACGETEPKGSLEQRKAERERALAKRLKAACASDATNERLKQVAFDEAIRIRNADPENLDILSTHALARVENPVVKTRDETLDVTVCSGRLVLHIPPGAEKAFDGKSQLAADIEYAAQAAADGSGLVYQMKGAEPIIYSLAAFDLKAEAYRPARAAAPTMAAASPTPAARRPPPAPRQPSAAPTAVAAAPTAAPARSVPSAAARPTPAATAARASASPSFNCRRGQSRSERMVCGSGELAALDRSMSSQFYSALSRADESSRAALRRTRDQFLSRRERCGDEACVARVYRERMDEIRDIAR